MSDNIPLTTLAKIGDILQEDSVINPNEPLKEAITHPYVLFQYTANTVPLFAISLKGTLTDPIPMASVNKIHTLLINDGLIPINSGSTSTTTTNGFFYYVQYASNNKPVFSVSRGAGGDE